MSYQPEYPRYKLTYVIQQFPSFMGDEVQYYYRRGCKFFFRSKDKSNKLHIRVDPYLLDEIKSELKFLEMYTTIEE